MPDSCGDVVSREATRNRHSDVLHAQLSTAIAGNLLIDALEQEINLIVDDGLFLNGLRLGEEGADGSTALTVEFKGNRPKD